MDIPPSLRTAAESLKSSLDDNSDWDDDAQILRLETRLKRFRDELKAIPAAEAEAERRATLIETRAAEWPLEELGNCEAIDRPVPAPFKKNKGWKTYRDWLTKIVQTIDDETEAYGTGPIAWQGQLEDLLSLLIKLIGSQDEPEDTGFLESLYAEVDALNEDAEAEFADAFRVMLDPGGPAWISDTKAAIDEVITYVESLPEKTQVKTLKPFKRKGRKRDTDPKADKQIAEAWGTGRYKTYAELEMQMELPKGEVKLAIDRHRHRKP